MDREQPETSVIVRAFNEERWLPELLRSLRTQDYQDFEVLLVDSGSVDRTRDIADEHGVRIVRLRPEDFTFGYSLNVGISEARGRLIAIVSAHCVPKDSQWLGRLVKPLNMNDVAMVYGGQRGHDLSKFSEARDFERTYHAVPRRLRPPEYFANNANSAIRKDLWKLRPFDEGLPGLEDIDWAKHWLECGFTVVYEPEASVHHIHEETWRQVRHRYHREAVAAHWIGLCNSGDIPVHFTREVRWCAADLLAAVRQGRTSLAGEIVRFRYEKLVGTIGGILNGKSFANPAKRSEMYFDKEFSAVVIRGPHQAALEERVIPNIKPGEILVRIAYQGICATDLEIYEGSLGYYRSGFAKYPIVPGHECSGTVAALGARVTGVQEGDRVVVECIQGCGECADCDRDNAVCCRERREVGVIGHDGGYAKYLVTRARYVHRIPDELTLREAALAEPLAVVVKSLRRLASASAGEAPRRVAVVGAGAIGHLTARVLALRGHDVTVFDRDPARLSLFGETLNVSSDLNQLDRFDWLVEATGDQAALEPMLQKSATGATLLLVGLPYAHAEFSFEAIVGFDRTVVGSVGSSGRDFADALSLLSRLDTKPFLQRTLPLTEYERAWEEVRGRRFLKIMLQADPAAV